MRYAKSILIGSQKAFGIAVILHRHVKVKHIHAKISSKREIIEEAMF